MRLITHNFLVCNLQSCVGRDISLILQSEEVKDIEQEFNPELTKRLLTKLNWGKLVRAAESLGFSLPQTCEEVDWESEANTEVLQLLHKVLFNTEIISGSLVCEECGRAYRIDRSIPNMVLEEIES